MGFVSPSEIQEKSIPLLLGRDIDFIGQAQTGTGKTAAFALPLLEKINSDENHIQAIIIAPTRELANQICEEIQRLSKFDPVRTIAVYGGISVSMQLRDLKKARPHIVVGTPGRIIDFIERDALRLADCKTVILDEADEMLDMGFFDDVKLILKQITNKKVWMFSATMPREILQLIQEHFHEPERVKVTKQILTADAITQQYCVVKERDKVEALCRYLDFNESIYAIVFCRTKIGTQMLTDELNARGYAADSLHGDMSQDQRDFTMKKFKEKKITLLACTDVAARGIDVSDLTHVINFSLPQDNESYVHRIGRTGRGGSKGIALSILDNGEMGRIGAIERITKAKIERIKLPTVEEIKSVILKKSLEQFEAGIERFEKNKDANFEIFMEKFSELSQEQLLKGIYSFLFEQSLKRYSKSQDIDLEPRMGRESSSRASGPSGARGQGQQAGYNRFFINCGRVHNMLPGDLIKFIARELGVRGGEVGRIDLKENFSFFEMPEKFKEGILDLNGRSLKGAPVFIEVAKADPVGGSRPRSNGPRSNGPRPSRPSGRREGGNFQRRSNPNSERSLFN